MTYLTPIAFDCDCKKSSENGVWQFRNSKPVASLPISPVSTASVLSLSLSNPYYHNQQQYMIEPGYHFRSLHSTTCYEYPLHIIRLCTSRWLSSTHLIRWPTMCQPRTTSGILIISTRPWTTALTQHIPVLCPNTNISKLLSYEIVTGRYSSSQKAGELAVDLSLAEDQIVTSTLTFMSDPWNQIEKATKWKITRFFHVIPKLYSGSKKHFDDVDNSCFVNFVFCKCIQFFLLYNTDVISVFKNVFLFQILCKYWIVATMLVLVSISYGLVFTMSISLWVDAVWKNVAKMNYKLQC